MHHDRNASQTTVLIAGAGIGGLTAAIALRRLGMDVLVLEKSHEIRAIGAGISLQMNATAALDHIGLCDAIREAGNTIQSAAIVRPDGQQIANVPFQRISDAMGFPFVAIHRGRLQALLLDALGEEHVRTGTPVEHIEVVGERVRVGLPDGSFAEGDMLIGADGINSHVRKHLWGEQPKRYTGYTAWRGICPDPHLTPPTRFIEVWGERQVFGYAPVDDRQMYWFATKHAPAGLSDDGDPRDDILKRFAHLPVPVSTLIESTAPEHLLRNDIFDRPPIARWGRGRITLLGDAAHPMTPNLGQGGCQAIEDAVVLAHMLSQADDLERALLRYEKRRQPRTRQFVKHSRLLTAMSHGYPLWARIARATVFRWMPETVKLREMRQLYRFEL